MLKSEGNGCAMSKSKKLNVEPDVLNQFDSKVHVYWHEGPRIEVFAEEIETLVNRPSPAPTKRSPVFYHGGQNTVELGDEVTARFFFFRRQERIVYVPGKSKKN